MQVVSKTGAVLQLVYHCFQQWILSGGGQKNSEIFQFVTQNLAFKQQKRKKYTRKRPQTHREVTHLLPKYDTKLATLK